MAGFAPGWHVLDAGCGSGSYLPVLAKQVKELGALGAVDLAPENVGLARRRLAEWGLGTAVEIMQGSILDLPFEDDTFDAVWCANTVQYLSDEELLIAISEFARVVRPGGLIAVKEIEPHISTVQPSPSGVFERSLELSRTAGTVHAHGVLRSWNLKHYLADAGLVDTAQKSMIIEHRSPLTDAELAFTRQYLGWYANAALVFDIPDQDRIFWESQTDQTAKGAIASCPDFYRAEGQTLASGRVPEGRT